MKNQVFRQQNAYIISQIKYDNEEKTTSCTNNGFVVNKSIEDSGIMENCPIIPVLGTLWKMLVEVIYVESSLSLSDDSSYVYRNSAQNSGCPV